MERTRRTGGVPESKEFSVKGGRAVPNWRKFLSNLVNKKALTHFLCTYIASDGQKKLKDSPDKKYMLAGGFNDGTQTKVVTGDGVQDMPTMHSTHEEADTRMLLHATVFNKEQVPGAHARVIIESPDTDVMVLAVHYCPKMRNVSEVWIIAQNKCVPIHSICEQLSPSLCDILPIMHSLTGCDTTSSFLGIGKKTALKVLLQDSEKHKDLITLIGNNEETAIEAASKFVISLYEPKAKKDTSINQLRIKLAKRKDKDIARIPPCEDAFTQHTKRCMWQAKLWTSAHINDPDVGNVEDYGWKKDAMGTLSPIFFEGPTAAELLSDLVCACKGRKKCYSGCACNQLAMACTSLCTCEGDPEECGNVNTQLAHVVSTE